MSKLPHIVHLVDDTTPGGVMRVLDYIYGSPLMAQAAHHEIRAVPRNKGIPAVQADMIVSHLSISWRRLPALVSLRARHAHLPLVHVEHSYTEAFTALNVPSKLRFLTLLRNAYALFDTVVAVSHAQGDWLTARRLVQPQALRVIPSAVDLRSFRALPAPRPGGRTIGAIGRLDRQKGFDVLIRAVTEIRDASLRLEIFGTGAEEESLRALAKGDERITFHGHAISPEAAMRAVDLVAMPSRWEAYGLVALEARAAGRRLVVADVDGLRDSAGPEARFVRGHGIASWSNALSLALRSGADAADQSRASGAAAEFAAAWNNLVSERLGPSVTGLREAG